MATQDALIGNNIIYTKKKGSQGKVSVETVLFGAEQVDVGIKSGKKEIAQDKESGFKYERDEIKAKTVYSLKEQKHSCFFILDLETGRGGKSWYPGCIQVADIVGNDVEVKGEPSQTAQTLFTLNTGDVVQILDLVYDEQKQIWYSIKYDETSGFVRNTYITNVRFVDPV